MKQTDKDIAAAGKMCDKFDKKVEETKLQIKKIEHELKQMDKDSEDARKAVEAWQRQHGWIKSEKHLFGVAGGDYDFESAKASKASKRLAELQAQQDTLGKKINKKVMGMFEKAEEEYQDVMEKKRIGTLFPLSRHSVVVLLLACCDHLCCTMRELANLGGMS